MDGGSIARRYARALFELAREKGRAEQVGSELQLVWDTLRSRPELGRVWDHAEPSARVKAGMVRQELGDKVSELTTNFLGVVASRHREGLLADIIREYGALVDESLNRVEVEVRSAVPLTDDLRARLETKLASSLGKQVKFRTLVDKDLLGGLVVRVDDVLMDGSIRTQLKRMRDRLAQATQAGAS